MTKRPIQRKISDSKPKAPRFARPAQLAKFLGCDQRTVRKYCKEGLIQEAEQTAGGHWRIRMPLSGKTKNWVYRLKNPSPKGHRLGFPIGDFDEEDAERLLMAAARDADWLDDALDSELLGNDLPKQDWAPIQRKIVERLRKHEACDDLLLVGWIFQLERSGKATQQRLAECLGLTRPTFHRRYVETGMLAKARQQALAFVGRPPLPEEGDPNLRAKNPAARKKMPSFFRNRLGVRP
jgi:hypothetical protein